MPSNNGSGSTGSEVFARWRADVITGKPPILYPAGEGLLGEIEIGPERVTLIGGAPGAGKTALTMQLAIDAVRTTKHLRACICNVEMSPAVLLDRQLARLSGVPLTLIRQRINLGQYAEAIQSGIDTIEEFIDRLVFVRQPFTMANITATGDAFGDVSLLVLDYVQRITPKGTGHDSKRMAVDALMDEIRKVANSGVAVMAISAVGRTKDKKGRSSYAGDGLGLASFKESGGLEYGADDAFIVVPHHADEDMVVLKQFKSRYGEMADRELIFDRRYQHFSDPASSGKSAGASEKEDLSQAWAKAGKPAKGAKP